jgi:hypothetical protein
VGVLLCKKQSVFSGLKDVFASFIGKTFNAVKGARAWHGAGSFGFFSVYIVSHFLTANKSMRKNYKKMEKKPIVKRRRAC